MSECFWTNLVGTRLICVESDPPGWASEFALVSSAIPPAGSRTNDTTFHNTYDVAVTDDGVIHLVVAYEFNEGFNSTAISYLYSNSSDGGDTWSDYTEIWAYQAGDDATDNYDSSIYYTLYAPPIFLETDGTNLYFITTSKENFTIVPGTSFNEAVRVAKSTDGGSTWAAYNSDSSVDLTVHAAGVDDSGNIFAIGTNYPKWLWVGSGSIDGDGEPDVRYGYSLNEGAAWTFTAEAAAADKLRISASSHGVYMGGIAFSKTTGYPHYVAGGHRGSGGYEQYIQYVRGTGVSTLASPVNLLTDDVTPFEELNYSSYGGPKIMAFSSGRLVIVFGKIDVEFSNLDNTISSIISDDQGATWGAETTIMGDVDSGFGQGKFVAVDPDTNRGHIVQYAEIDGDTGLFHSYTDDEGDTWSAPTLIPAQVVGGSYAIASDDYWGDGWKQPRVFAKDGALYLVCAGSTVGGSNSNDIYLNKHNP